MVAKLREVARKCRKRNLEDAVSYAVAHGIRVDILCYLNEAPRSPSELSRLMGLLPSTVEHHVNELLASSSIELARVVKVRNTTEHFYRAVEIPFYTDEEMNAMPVEVRQEIYGLILQSSMAEALAAFRAGKVSGDPRAWMSWGWFDVDIQAREDMAKEDRRTWERRHEIAAEAVERSAETGEELVSIIVSLLTHERCRNFQNRPARSGAAD